jgi:serine/threonine protein kinase
VPEASPQQPTLEPLQNGAVTKAPSSETEHQPREGAVQAASPELDPLATLPVESAGEEFAGRYRVLRPHAQGGLGRVLVAKDNELQREVALKEIRPDYSDDVDCRARFMREAEITGRLEHPGIVPVYSLGKYPDGSPYYAMRFIRGTSLQDAIKKFHSSSSKKKRGGSQSQRNLELRRLVQRLIDVCETVDYAHSRGVLHRDIKPSNIMLGAYGETLVVDWGLAKPIGKNLSPAMEIEHSPDVSCLPAPSLVVPNESDSEPTRLGAAVGTPAFMSPEQALGQHDALGPASDVFSLGATLYQILTGVPPYGGQDIVRHAQRASFPPPRAVHRNVPRALEAICMKAMAAKTKDRYGAAGELAQELERYLADEPILARPDRGLDYLFRMARRHRAWAQAGALALGLIAIIATGAAISIHGSLQRAQLAEESAVRNLEMAEAARQQEAARAEAEAVQRKRAEGAEELARISAERATAEKDRAEREKRIVQMMVAEHAPDLLRLPGGYFADRQSVADFTAALVTARQADPHAEEQNREALATFARLLRAKRVFRDDGAANAADRYLFEKVVLPSLNVPPPTSPTTDDRKHLGLLWAAKARLIERNPVHGFLVAAGIKLNDADDEFIEAMRTSHAAYRRAYELHPDSTAAAGSLRTWCKLPPRSLDQRHYEAELTDLASRLTAGSDSASTVLPLAEAIQLSWQARAAASSANEQTLYQEVLGRLTKLETTTRGGDPYSLRTIGLLSASEACLAVSRITPVQSSEEATGGGGNGTKFSWLNQAMDWAGAAEHDGPPWSRQAARLVKANVLEELAHHYKELTKYQQASDLYGECIAEQDGIHRTVAEANLGRCQFRWSQDAWRSSRSSAERIKHLQSAYGHLRRALETMAAESTDAQALAQTHSYLGQLLFQAACEGLNVADRQMQWSSLGAKSAAELKKLLHESGGSDDIMAEIRERLSQVELAAQESKLAAETAHKTSAWRWIEYAQQAASYQKYAIEQQSPEASDSHIMAAKLKQFQADVEGLVSLVAATPDIIPIARRAQLVDLAVAARRFSSTGTSTNPRQYEKLYPEKSDEALLERVLLTLADTSSPQVRVLRQAEELINEMKQPATVSLARGHCEKFKADLLYGGYRSRVADYVKSPESNSGLTLNDDAKLRAVQHLYAAALHKRDGASDAKTGENLSGIYGMRLQDLEDRRWSRTISPLEAEWLRRTIEDSESVRMTLYRLLTARLYLHGAEWRLNDAKQPLAEEGQAVARQIVECLKPLRFLELYFGEHKLDDYQRQLLQLCESRG